MLGTAAGRTARVGIVRVGTWIRSLPWLAWRPWIVAGSIGAVVCGLLIALVGYTLSMRTPAWWQPAVFPDMALAEALENGLVTQLSRVRPQDISPAPAGGPRWRSEVWRVSISSSDANAWLNARLPKWLANRNPPVRWPKEVDQLQVEFTEGEIHIGVRLRDGTRSRIVSATVRPTIEDGGAMWVPARRIAVGTMPIPPSWVLDSVRGVSEGLFPQQLAALPETRTMFDAFAGRRPIVLDAVIRLEGGRRVRLLNIVPRNGRLELTCRTEAR